jgi:hypothetical protein
MIEPPCLIGGMLGRLCFRNASRSAQNGFTEGGGESACALAPIGWTHEASRSRTHKRPS